MTQIQVIENPIQNMQFDGLHWIEASAGTGKTYTLSSLMVRIFIEKYLPKQVIATTFTRKAAAELKSRIRKRVYQTLVFLEEYRGMEPDAVREQAIAQKDPLLKHILMHQANAIGHACNKLQLALDQFDELFVGTLDSFSQNLLREFAFESGKIERAEITADESVYVNQLIHDILREWIQSQPQGMVNLLLMSQNLKSADHYAQVVGTSLNFASIPVNPPEEKVFDIDGFNALFVQLGSADLTELSDFYLLDGVHYSYVNKRIFSTNRFNTIFTIYIPNICAHIEKYGAESYFDQRIALERKNLYDLFYDDKNTEYRVFDAKKCPDDVKIQFYQHPIIQLLKQLVDCNDQIQAVDQYLKFHVASEVRNRLPQLLQQKGETTFSQQIRSLAEALQGAQGQQFAAFVHDRYPLILVDEFQDTNQDQDDMLASIWRDLSRFKKGCMIMVGDRKQAIYGFRGGDMLTFLKAHQDVAAKHGRFYQLRDNFRSVAPLVEVVDTLFQRQPDFGEDVQYTPIQAGGSHPDLFDADGMVNHKPLRWIQLEQSDQEAEQVAWQIQEILNRHLYLLVEDEDVIKRPITVSDIAVLSKNHSSLNQVQSKLLSMGIPVNRAARRSVFASDLAQDVAAVLEAILNPFNEAKVKRTLLSRLIGFKLQDLWVDEHQSLDLSRFMVQFEHMRTLWMDQSFLSAWQYFLNYFHVWENLVIVYSRENERRIVNLRHLTELLCGQSEQIQGASHLMHWYLKQLKNPSERDWEKERPLSNTDGVQLMTIHQSKGLEFKIVFLMGADSDPRDETKLLFSFKEVEDENTGKHIKQRQIDIYNKADVLKLEQHQTRIVAEHNRLWYVALTRASYRVYAMLKPVPKTAKAPAGLAFWRGQGEAVFEHEHSILQPLLLEQPANLYQATQQDLPDLDAEAFPEKRFYAKTKTSFTALAQHQAHATVQDQLAQEQNLKQSAEDEQNQSDFKTELASQPINWIKQHFPKGTVGGTFLHSIFEHLDFQDQTYWNLEIRRRFKNTAPQIWTELKQKFLNAFPIEVSLKNAFLTAYLYSGINLERLFKQALNFSGYVPEQVQDIAKATLASVNFKLISDIREHDATGEYRKVWQAFFKDAQQFNSADFNALLSKLLPYFEELNDDVFIQQFERDIAQVEKKASSAETPFEALPLFYEAFDALANEMVEDILLNLMHDWIAEILMTPIQSNFALQQLEKGSYLSEFPFYLSLNDAPLQIKKIQALFASIGYDMSDFNEAKSARYLTGSIDLVYFDGQRYHIADYKSNFLGADQLDYSETGIQANMTQSSYWLQAALYLVAMHRYLASTMQGYNMREHLGGATYLYLRGMQGDTGIGAYHWQVTFDFIEKLDQILGYFVVQKSA